MNLNNYYYYFEKALSPEVCENIINTYTSFKFNNAEVKGENKNVKNIRNSEVFFADDPELYDTINPFIHEANFKAGWNFEWDWTEACQITRYTKDQFYDWHMDQLPDVYPSDYKFISQRNKIRKLSTVISLSNPDDYTGGQFQFDFRNKKNINGKEIKDVRNIVNVEHLKQQGTVVVFPSFIWHRVRPVLSGVRYSLVSWSLGPAWR